MSPPYQLITVNHQYCDYLRKFDYRVYYNSKEKQFRPFVGILFEINNIKYFAPLSSPKQKHLHMKSQIDYLKIDNGNLGIINFNNMIPIPEKEYQYINMNKSYSTISEKLYLKLLKKQLRWLNRHGEDLRKKARILYTRRINSQLPKIISNRCCDFALLEQKCIEYTHSIH